MALTACDDDSPVAPTNPVEHHEQVVAEVNGDVSSGGKISLPNGMEITVDVGNSHLTLRHIAAERYFDAPNRNAYDIVTEPLPDRMTIRFPGVAGRDSEHVGVFRYDLQTNEGSEQPFSYDPATGVITVVVTTTGSKERGSPAGITSGKGTRWVTEVDPLIAPTHDLVEIAMPYYQQDDRTCWAATTKMFAAAYNNGTMTLVPDLLKSMNSDLATGINHLKYWTSLPGLLGRVTGKTTSALWCWRSTPAREKLVDRLDKGIPVSMALNLPDHSVVVIGYKRTYGQGAIPTYEFKIHDPSDPKEMNIWHPWSWFEARKPSMYSFQLIWPDVAPPVDLPQQTIGLPLANTGSVRAVRVGTNCDGDRRVDNVARFTFRSDAPSGYDFSAGSGTWANPVPGDITDFGLELPMWNAAATDATLNIAIKLSREGSSTFEYYENLDTTIAAVSATHDLIRFLPLSGPRDKSSATHYTLTIEMWGSGRKLDFWSIAFDVAPATPVIKSIDPCSGPWGTPVTVRGVHFGQSYDRDRCQVIFDRQPAITFTTWNDSTIVATVPQGATSGDMVVLVDGSVSNGRFFEVDDQSSSYSMKQYVVTSDAFDGPFTFGGTLTAENMVVDDDSPGSLFQTVAFTITGSPPASVALKRTFTGTFKRDYLSYTDTAGTLWENVTTREFVGWILRLETTQGTVEQDIGTSGTCTLDLSGINLKSIAPGIWSFNAQLLFRYRQTFTVYAGGAVQDRQSTTTTMNNLLVLGYLQQ